MSNLNEEQALIERAQHDRQAFAEFYDRYVDRIYAYLLRQTNDPNVAQDLTAASFEKAMLALPKFRWQNISPLAWLYRIARSQWVAHYRKQRWLSPLSLYTKDHQQTNPVQAVETNQEQKAIENALNQLSRADSEILRLRYYEDLPAADMARILNCSSGALYTRLHRALAHLRRELEKESSPR